MSRSHNKDSVPLQNHDLNLWICFESSQHRKRGSSSDETYISIECYAEPWVSPALRPCYSGEIKQQVMPHKEDFRLGSESWTKKSESHTKNLIVRVCTMCVNDSFILGTLIEWWPSFIMGYSFQNQHIPMVNDHRRLCVVTSILYIEGVNCKRKQL